VVPGGSMRAAAPVLTKVAVPGISPEPK